MGLVVVIMGQNCEKFINMCIESVEDADQIIYVDGGSDNRWWELPIWPKNLKVIENKYDQEDPMMNGKQRNFYLEYVKKNYPGWYCLVLDADEVLDTDGIKKIKEFLKENGK